MNCPKCGAMMRERERGDVIMDVCPSGDGIWLDGGELERLTNERREYVRSHPGYRPDDDDDDEWYYRRHEGDAQTATPAVLRGNGQLQGTSVCSLRNLLRSWRPSYLASLRDL